MTTKLYKHMRAFVPVAVAISLVACSSSSSDESGAQTTPPMDTDPTNTPDPTLIPDFTPGTDTTPDATALGSASRVDVIRYNTLIENVRAVVDATEFTSDNYASAVAAIAETSEAHIVYTHIDLLSLLERQVLANESILTPTDINEASLNDNQGDINRVHGCPDGGRLLAVKANPSDMAGRFSFEACQVGELLIDGGYTVQLNRSDNAFTTDINLGININGVDGVLTTLSGSIIKNETISANPASGDISTSETRLDTTTTVAIPTGPVLSMEVSSLNTLSGAADTLASTEILPAQTYTVAMGNMRVWVDDNNNARLSGTTTLETVLTKAANASTFEQGEIQFSLLPNTNVMTANDNNGDSGSFDAFVTLADSSVVSFVVPWDSGDYEFGPQGSALGFSESAAGE